MPSHELYWKVNHKDNWETMSKKLENEEVVKGITLLPLGGIACRIRTISSMIHIAKEYNRPLEILWRTDDYMPVSTDRLFTLKPNLGTQNVKIRQMEWTDCLLNTPPMPSNFFLSFPFVTLGFDKVLSPKKVEHLMANKRTDLEELLKDPDKSILVATGEGFGKFLGMYDVLEATVEVNNVLLSSMASWRSRMVGVHINRRINPQTTFSESPIELFIRRMQEMIEADPEICFFIATTSKNERERLATIFHDRVFVPHSVADPHTVKGVIQSFGELLALSHTERILTTPSSNYSKVASDLGGVPLETLSIYSSK